MATVTLYFYAMGISRFNPMAQFSIPFSSSNPFLLPEKQMICVNPAAAAFGITSV
jgi:hypothetical protein